MIPSIKITLPVLLVLWCVGSLWAFDGSPVLLAYPAMWVGVAALFYVVTKFGGPAASDAS